MVVALVGEVSVVKERLDTHERLAAQGKAATPEEIENYAPGEDVEDEREAWRAAMLERVFRIISATRDTDESADAADHAPHAHPGQGSEDGSLRPKDRAQSRASS